MNWLNLVIEALFFTLGTSGGLLLDRAATRQEQVNAYGEPDRRLRSQRSFYYVLGGGVCWLVSIVSAEYVGFAFARIYDPARTLSTDASVTFLTIDALGAALFTLTMPHLISKMDGWGRPKRR